MKGNAMNIILLVFDYDMKDWAKEYGIGEADAAADLTAVLRRTVTDGAIPAILDRSWPMMRGHVTAHTVDGLGATIREELLHLLREARDTDTTTALIAEITEHLGRHRSELDDRAPGWVVFHTSEWDDGHFLTGSDATVYFHDGHHVPFDFEGSSVDDLLTDLYGACGSRAALGVDLREQTLAFDDDGDDVPALLGIPTR
jgi:hypothetical protein